jgi:hypothetical protein
MTPNESLGIDFGKMNYSDRPTIKKATDTLYKHQVAVTLAARTVDRFERSTITAEARRKLPAKGEKTKELKTNPISALWQLHTRCI